MKKARFSFLVIAICGILGAVIGIFISYSDPFYDTIKRIPILVLASLIILISIAIVVRIILDFLEERKK